MGCGDYYSTFCAAHAAGTETETVALATAATAARGDSLLRLATREERIPARAAAARIGACTTLVAEVEEAMVSLDVGEEELPSLSVEAACFKFPCCWWRLALNGAGWHVEGYGGRPCAGVGAL